MPWKAQNRERDIAANTSKSDRIIRKLINVYAWLGVLLIPANLFIVLPLVFVVWFQSNVRSAGIVATAALALDVAIYAGFWILDSASTSFPGLRKANDVE